MKQSHVSRVWFPEPGKWEDLGFALMFITPPRTVIRRRECEMQIPEPHGGGTQESPFFTCSSGDPSALGLEAVT